MKVKGRRQSEYAVPTTAWDSIIAGILKPFSFNIDEDTTPANRVTPDDYDDVTYGEFPQPEPEGTTGVFSDYRRGMDKNLRDYYARERRWADSWTPEELQAIEELDREAIQRGQGERYRPRPRGDYGEAMFGNEDRPEYTGKPDTRWPEQFGPYDYEKYPPRTKPPASHEEIFGHPEHDEGEPVSSIDRSILEALLGRRNHRAA